MVVFMKMIGGMKVKGLNVDVRRGMKVKYHYVYSIIFDIKSKPINKPFIFHMIYFKKCITLFHDVDCH